MENHINYLTNLLDFIIMQRTSFCWFLTEGIAEELKWLSRMYIIKKNIDYVTLSEEYSLIKPPCTSIVARKWEGNFRTQLVLPISIRITMDNEIIYESKYPVVAFPLMSISATFILNGCERVVISQIIRSPGIYFEKQKAKKKVPIFQRKTSLDLGKLHLFVPAGEASFSESDLFFSNKSPINQTERRKKIFIKTVENSQVRVKQINIDKTLQQIFSATVWTNTSIYAFSITCLVNRTNDFSFYFLQNFKFYQIIVNEVNSIQKQKLILFLYKWLKKTIYKKNQI